MGELVRQQPAAAFSMRREPARSESNLVTAGPGTRAHCLCRLSRVLVRVDTHAAEVVVEARFHQGARGVIEGLAGGASDLLNRAGNGRITRSGLVARQGRLLRGRCPGLELRLR